MSERTTWRNVLQCGLWAAVAMATAAAGTPVVDAGQPTGVNASRPAIHGILFNEDDSNPFCLDPPGEMKPERLDQVVDRLADSQVTTMLICCNAKRTNYDSKVWEMYGFDPTRDTGTEYGQWGANIQAIYKAGVDPVQRMIDRCRQRNISPWVSIRMNDAHDATVPVSPLHSQFWMDHPEYHLPNYGMNIGLDYGLKPVRDHYMALLREVCDRFDMDGLELDWNRFPHSFRRGEEIAQGQVLTGWLGEVREVVRAAEQKWNHPICLAARVPARPQASMGTGLDAVTWAQQGLIDHLIVAPFLTTDFDVPVEQWNQLLSGTGVGVTVGLEHAVGASWYEQMPNTPELRRGAAMAALARGSQGTYLFNHFAFADEEKPYLLKEPYLLQEMGSVETLADKDRSYAVTYADINDPNTPMWGALGALPRTLSPGESADFSLFIGPKPLERVWKVNFPIRRPVRPA
jgi:hypothetical protein